MELGDSLLFGIENTICRQLTSLLGIWLFLFQQDFAPES